MGTQAGMVIIETGHQGGFRCPYLLFTLVVTLLLAHACFDQASGAATRMPGSQLLPLNPFPLLTAGLRLGHGCLAAAAKG